MADRRVSLIALRLPNGDIVFQRRDNNAGVAPRQLGFFGGSVEKGETPLQAMKRELQEETSLDVGSLDIQPAASFTMDRKDIGLGTIEYNVFTTNIKEASFSVFEGVGSEVYSYADALLQTDLTPSVKIALTDYLGV